MVEVQHQPFMSINKKLSEVHEKFILDCSKANIGPTLTFKFLKEVLGCYEMMGCTVGDIRNASRDIKAYAHGCDIQMVMDNIRRKKELSDAFTYHYEVNSENQLQALFWYCMIFTPFTGKGNHGKPVSTFAVGLVLNKKTGVAPKMIVTDQDGAMRSAIEEILVGTKHRWCMWHIMYKLAVKAPKKLLTDDHFEKEFNACVWSDLHEPAEFEEIWNGIIEEYGLQDVEWFNTMYCHQNFYKNFLKPRLNLAEFYLSFNNALESQRHSSAKLDYADSTIVPILATDQPFEKHASTLFTDSMFRKMKVEIVEGCNRCRIVGLTSEGMIDFYKVGDSYRNTFVIMHDKNHDSYACECKLFGSCIGRYQANVDTLRAFVSGVSELAVSLDSETPPISAPEKRRIIEEFYGMVRPQVIEVHAPDVVQTKGSCSTKGKRIISKREKAIKEFNRPVRRCGKCQELGHHDSRNCDRVKENKLEKEKKKTKDKGKEKC
ncbi:protein FAR1-RELATED SEQUENCE 5-like [Salvia splendens]|uniref:protein FAR1-RELATED SEQUENCE 5-like n=1 Tax=Salvia splendens TaxID=180675 RepID=UPI001C2599A0|nr:protein FAR1-RELATED SEQUENCE 5-like [Salvia splendens]